MGAFAQLTPISSIFVVVVASTLTIRLNAERGQEQEKEDSRTSGSRTSGSRTSGTKVKAVKEKAAKERAEKAAGAITIEATASLQVLVTMLMLC